MKKLSILLGLLGCIILSPSLWAEEEGEHEIYYILQKGFINVAGKTNIFDFKGEALKHEGELTETHGSYTGNLLLRFSQLKFDLPMVDEVLQKKEYMNSTAYPTVSIELKNFKPLDKPAEVKANLEMHGVKKPVTIETQFQYLPPVVKVTGSFSIAQSDFGVKPYRAGLMKVKDDLSIEFKVFFCEVYTENADHKISAKTAAKLAEEDQIQVLMEKGFFGCAEIKNKQGKP